MNMKKMSSIAVWLWFVGAIAGSAAEPVAPVETLNVMYTAQSGYQADDMRMIAKIFKDLSGVEVNLDYVNYDQQYEKIVELSSTYDVIALDEIWLADLVTKGILDPLDENFSKKMLADIDPKVLQAFRYQDKIWAFPFLLNYQLFFYNQTMLGKAGFQTPPKTLEELLQQMLTLKAQGIVTYPWTDAWKSGEHLICEYAWLTGAFGGSLFDDAGQPVFDQEAGLKALDFMAALLQQGLVDPNILGTDDLQAKDQFLSGQAAFTSNWTFLTGLIATPAILESGQQLGLGLLPASETTTIETASVSAFQGLGVIAKSAKKEAAWKWLKFSTSPLVQRAFMTEMPIWTSVQNNTDVNALDAQMTVKRTQLQNAAHRPKLPNYQQISGILQRHLLRVLQDGVASAEALAAAKAEMLALPPIVQPTPTPTPKK